MSIKPMIFLSPLLLLAWAFAMPATFAQDLAPDALLRSVSAQVTAAIKQDPRIQAGDARRIAALVEAKILPHFDFRRATQTAMGPHWRAATPEQQERLTAEF